MPDFIPVLISAVLLLIIIFVVFSGAITWEERPTNFTIFSVNDISISSIVSEQRITSLDGEISSGIIDTSNKEISFELTDTDVSEGIINLDINNTNLYGTLMIYVNGYQIYNDYARIGNHTIRFDGEYLKDQNVLEVKAESSGWKFWAPNIYIFDLDLSVDYLGTKKALYNFDVSSSEISGMKSAKLLIDVDQRRGNSMVCLLNRFEVYRGSSDADIQITFEILKTGLNHIEFFTERNSDYNISSAQIVLYR